MDYICVKINNWEKYNPRKDVKRPSWFPFDNGMVEDDDFLDFNHGEFKAWIWLLSKASKKQDGVVIINLEAARRKSNISVADFTSAVKKLEQLGIITVDVTYTSRTRHVHVTLQTDRQTDNTDTHTDTSTYRGRFVFDEVYFQYPRKLGKAEGLKRLTKEIKTEEDFEKLKSAVQSFAKHHKKIKTEEKFIPYFSTWTSSWRDWLEQPPKVPPGPPAEKPKAEWDYDEAEHPADKGLYSKLFTGQGLQKAGEILKSLDVTTVDPEDS